MANSPRRIYWDACTWIALIQQEKIPDSGKKKVIEDRYQMCRTVIEAAKKGVFEIATSALSLVEVCKHPIVKGEPDQKIADFFENDYILSASLDKHVATIARDIMKKTTGALKPPDACHLATASIANVEEMHTFDQRLLDLDRTIQTANGEMLKICKPHASRPDSQASLFDKDNISN